MKLGGLIVFLLAITSAHAQEVNDKVDPFTGDRNIDFTQSEGVRHVFTLKATIHQTTVNGLIVLMVVPKLDDRAHQSYEHADCHRLDWMVDGQPFPIGDTVYEPKRDGMVIYEVIGQPITPDQIRRIGNASSVVYRLCNDEHPLDAVEMAGFRKVGERIDEAMKQPSHTH